MIRFEIAEDNAKRHRMAQTFYEVVITEARRVLRTMHVEMDATAAQDGHAMNILELVFGITAPTVARIDADGALLDAVEGAIWSLYQDRLASRVYARTRIYIMHNGGERRLVKDVTRP